MKVKVDKKTLFKFIIGVVLIFGSVILYYNFSTPNKNLIINEVVSSNSNIIADDDGEYHDWIEIWNPTDTEISTKGYQLISNQVTWDLPPITIGQGEYLLVWASDKDRNFDSDSLHSNFTLSKSGEVLVLFSKEANKVMDKIRLPDLNTNTSYGRSVVSPNRKCFFAYPTPNAPNSPGCYKNLNLGAPKFSHDSGLHEQEFLLSIKPQYRDEKIIYTLDGSFPDLERNPESTLIYENPVKINATNNSTTLSSKWYGTKGSTYPERSKNLIPYSGTVIRAKTQFSAENSAFFFFSNMGEITLPIVSLTMENDYLIDPKLGLYTPGQAYEEYLDSSDFDENLKINFPANFFNRGIEWERPFSKDTRNAVIFHFCQNSKCLTQNVGIRNHGNVTRRFPMKSLRLYAREEYGKGYFEGNFFNDQKVSKYKRLILRNSGQDWGVTMLADGTYHSIVEKLNLDTQNYQPVVLFINGEYWGIHNLRERYDKFYFAQKYNLNPEDITLIDNFFNVQEGSVKDADDFKNFIDDIARLEFGDSVAINTIEQIIDIENFYDYMIVQTFFAPFDWPTNNNRLWKAHNAESDQDSLNTKWRWVITDLEWAGHNSVDHVAGVLSFDYYVERIRNAELTVRFSGNYNPYEDAGVSLILIHILSNQETRNAFLSRYQELLNDDLSADSMSEVIATHSAAIRPEMKRHIDRWGYPRSLNVWEGYIDELEKFLTIRSEFMINLIKENYI